MHIPFLGTPDKALSSTTQDLLPVADIVDGVVVYENGGATGGHCKLCGTFEFF